jgi:hypothetical protein
MVMGWCPSPRQGRPYDSKSTYKDNYSFNGAWTRDLSNLRPVRFSSYHNTCSIQIILCCCFRQLLSISFNSYILKNINQKQLKENPNQHHKKKEKNHEQKITTLIVNTIALFLNSWLFQISSLFHFNCVLQFNFNSKCNYIVLIWK